MTRNILLVTNASRQSAIDAFWQAIDLLKTNGLTPIAIEEDFAEMTKTGQEVEVYSDQPIELALVLGGDGTILRAAESLRGHKVPILGLNLGHVGFMAEGEIEDMPEIITRIAAGKYSTSSRMALEVEVYKNKELVFSSWALNDIALEKSSRERMLEVAIELIVDRSAALDVMGLFSAHPPAQQLITSVQEAQLFGQMWRRCWSFRSALTHYFQGHWWWIAILVWR